jgi:hypothetical protein
MGVCILQTSEIPVPNEIKILHNFGYVQVVFDDGSSTSGDHIMLQGKKEDIYKYFLQCKEVYIGVGPPMYEQFELYSFG